MARTGASSSPRSVVDGQPVFQKGAAHVAVEEAHGHVQLLLKLPAGRQRQRRAVHQLFLVLHVAPEARRVLLLLEEEVHVQPVARIGVVGIVLKEAHVHAGDAAGEFLSPGHLAQRHLHVGLARRQPQLAEQHVFEPRRVAPVGHGNLVAVIVALGRLQRQRKSPLAVRAALRREDLPSAPGQLQLQRRAGLRPAAHLHPRRAAETARRRKTHS